MDTHWGVMNRDELKRELLRLASTSDGEVDAAFAGRRMLEIGAQLARGEVEDAGPGGGLRCYMLPDTTLIWVNEAFARQTGRTPQGLTGVKRLDLVPASDRVYLEEQMSILSPKNPVLHSEHRAIGRDGLIWQRWEEHGHFDPDGRLLFIESRGTANRETPPGTLPPAQPTTTHKRARNRSVILRMPAVAAVSFLLGAATLYTSQRVIGQLQTQLDDAEVQIDRGIKMRDLMLQDSIDNTGPLELPLDTTWGTDSVPALDDSEQ